MENLNNDKLIELRNKNEINAKILNAIKNSYVEDGTIHTTSIMSVGEFDEYVNNDTKKIRLRSLIAQFLRDLGSLGFGKFIVGRRGYPSRFVLEKGISGEDIYNSSFEGSTSISEEENEEESDFTDEELKSLDDEIEEAVANI